MGSFSLTISVLSKTQMNQILQIVSVSDQEHGNRQDDELLASAVGGGG
jgi:hypothetical protein